MKNNMIVYADPRLREFMACPIRNSLLCQRRFPKARAALCKTALTRLKMKIYNLSVSN